MLGGILLRASVAVALATAIARPVCTAAPSAARDAAAETGWSLVALPGGVDGLRPILGRSLEAHRIFVEAARRVDGPDSETSGVQSALARHFDALKAAGGASADLVPLPLPPETWATAVFDRPLPPADVAAAVLRDRRASLIAHGLAGLDPPTLAWIAGRPGLLRTLYRRHAGAFAAFGRSLRVADGRLETAGGDRARAVWEHLVGQPTGDPEGFIEALMGREEGRLAWFYDTVAHLGDPLAARALGAPGAGLDPSRDRAAALARVFATVDRQNWLVEQRPFRRPWPDPALFVREMVVDPDGTLAGPSSRRFWNAAFRAHAPSRAGSGARDLERGEAVDVAWLSERIFADSPSRARDRHDAVLFTQRVFGRVRPAEWSDVVTAVQGLTAYPALMRTLERVGVEAAGTYAAAAIHAADLARVADRSEQGRLLIQFQGALALVAGALDAGALNDEAAARLVDGLARLRIDGRRGYAGGVARWLRADLLPALPALRGEAGDPVERRLLEALSGGGSDDGHDSTEIQWEGATYRVDASRAHLRRLEQTRRTQGASSLGAALALAEVASVLVDARSSDLVLAQIDVLDGLGPALPAVVPGPGVPAALQVDPARSIDSARRDLGGLPLDRGGVVRESDRGRVRAAAAALSRLADHVLADTLLGLTYAMAVAASDDVGLKSMSVARRHDLGLSVARISDLHRGPWSLPAPVPARDGRPWHVSGSLLALDLGLARMRLHRVETDRQPPPLMVDDLVQQTLAEHVVLLNPHRVDDRQRDEIAAALARGRSRVAGLAGSGESVDDLAGVAGMSAWRREAVRWLAAADPAGLTRAFSLAELLRLGWTGDPLGARLHAWGVSARALTGSLRPRFPPPRPWEDLTGHRATGLLGTELVDVTLRVAELLAEARVPAALAPAILAAATWDVTADAPTMTADDWYGLVEPLRHLPRERLDDYLTTLTGDGPLGLPRASEERP
jgi:hypothetical protein